MLVYFLNGVLDKSVAFYFFRDTFEDVVYLLVIFARGIVISVNWLLEF